MTMTMIRMLRSAAIAGVVAVSMPVAVAAQVRATPTPPPAAPAPGAGGAAASLQREVFVYVPGGRRDPFVSLATTNDLRPLVSDLKLVGILADPSGQRSVAVLRDLTDKSKQYRVTVGSTLGRMRVTRITSRDVTFTIEEFGRNRQEVLSYAADSLKRTP